MKYGLMKYEYGINKFAIGCNLGDEIQSLAASYFLPQIDCFIDREEISNSKVFLDEKIKLIMNGWYMHDWKQWPPAKNIEPLLISVNLSNKKFEKNIFSSSNRDYLIKYGPVGARDLHTLQIFQEHNIPAYFSGCLTLTLPKDKNIRKQDYILCIDVEKNIVEKIKRNTNRKVFEFSSTFKHQFFNWDEKFKYAAGLLKAYQSAAGVVTSRLHAAMPCLALETPVLLVRDFTKKDGRFDGLGDLVRKADNKFYLDNLDFFDVNNLTANSDGYLIYRKKLIEKCESFTGIKHRTTSSVVDISSLEEQLVSNIEVIHDAADRVSNKKLSYWYAKKKIAKFKRGLYYFKL